MKRKRQRLLSVLLIIILCITALPYTASAASFRDVPSGIWYKKDVDNLVAKGIMKGTASGVFSPNNALTRAEAITMLAKCTLPEGELDQYAGYTNFSDVPTISWYTKYVNWSTSIGVASGTGNSKFQPSKKITRQELAVMISNYCSSMWYKLSSKVNAVSFKDKASIASWASASIAACQKAGVISGANGNFKPKNNTTRAEAASMINRLISGAYSKDSTYTLTRKKINGISSDYVEFSTSNYKGNVLLANDSPRGNYESASSMIKRTGAKIAVNAGFFDMGSYDPYCTIIRNGSVIKTFDAYAPSRVAFTIDTAGRASLENFAVKRIPVLVKKDGTEMALNTNTVTNTRPSNSSDASRIIFTNVWGSSVGSTVKDAIAVDSNGVITAVVKDANDISIPKGGYVLYQRARRYYEGTFFASCEVGDSIRMETVFDGASKQNISSSIAVGPRLVKGWGIYGSISTYNAEGYYASDITSYAARRVAIGVKSNGNVIILTAYATLKQLSSIMQKVGCMDAMNLDGGGSTTIYLDGKWLRQPDRALSTMIYFK